MRVKLHRARTASLRCFQQAGHAIGLVARDKKEREERRSVAARGPTSYVLPGLGRGSHRVTREKRHNASRAQAPWAGGRKPTRAVEAAIGSLAQLASALEMLAHARAATHCTTRGGRGIPLYTRARALGVSRATGIATLKRQAAKTRCRYR